MLLVTMQQKEWPCSPCDPHVIIKFAKSEGVGIARLHVVRFWQTIISRKTKMAGRKNSHRKRS